MIIYKLVRYIPHSTVRTETVSHHTGLTGAKKAAEYLYPQIVGWKEYKDSGSHYARLGDWPVLMYKIDPITVKD